MATALISLALALAPVVDARTTYPCRDTSGRARTCCKDSYGRLYICSGGLSNGARIAIGVCVAVGVLLIFSIIGMIRRKQLAKQWSKYRPPAPVGAAAGTGDGSYANNPPPPTYATGGDSSVQSPPATYQPSGYNASNTAYTSDTGYNTSTNYDSNTGGAQHGLAADYYGSSTNPSSNNATGQSYEYQQQAEMDASKYGQAPDYSAPSGPPPGVNDNYTGSSSYAPPSGPPPKH